MGIDGPALERKNPNGATLLLDTSVLISYSEGDQKVTAAATLIIDDGVRDGRNRAIIDIVTAMEPLVGPIRATRGYDVEDFPLRFPNVTTAPLDFRAALHAAEMRANGLKGPTH